MIQLILRCKNDFENEKFAIFGLLFFKTKVRVAENLNFEWTLLFIFNVITAIWHMFVGYIVHNIWDGLIII